MQQNKSLKTLNMGKGTLLDLVQLEGAKEEYAAILTFDGEEGSEPFRIPPHWHKNHDEYITVLEGRMKVFIEDKTTVVSAGDETFFVPRRHVHSFSGFKGERTVFEERNDPAGIYKALFFNDAFDSKNMPGFWRGVRSGFDGDTYLSLSPLHSKLLDQLVVLVFGAIAKLFVPPKEKQL